MRVFFVAIGGQNWWVNQHTEGMEALGWEVQPFVDDAARFVGEATAFKPDLLYYFKHPQVTPDMVREVKSETGCRFVQFNGDQRGTNFIPEIWGNREMLDLVLINNSAQQPWYEANGFKKCLEWHLGVYPPLHKTYSVPEEFDVVFGGNAYRQFPVGPQRLELMEAVDNQFHLLTIGNWKLSNNHSWTSNEGEYCPELCRGKMTLGINHYHVPHYYTRRLWLCMAIGKLHLTAYIPGMERDFKKGRHLDWFSDTQEALDMIRYYLTHDKERERIGKQGQELVYKKHTVADRYKQLEKMLVGLKLLGATHR